MTTRSLRYGAALAASLLVVSCDRSSRTDSPSVSLASRDSTRTLGPGDVRIMNVDSAVEIAVIGDSIVAGLGPRTLEEIRRGTDTSAVTGSGFGADIEKFVKRTVAGALNHEITFAIADVSDVRYEDGTLRFYKNDGSRMKMFESTKISNKPVSETFSEYEAERFITAFRARKAKGV
jgi:hypothetical protein